MNTTTTTTGSTPAAAPAATGPAAPAAQLPALTGWTVLRVWRGAIYLRLPADLQRPIDGGCSCTHCTGKPAGHVPTWDTFAVPLEAGARSWTVHAPEWSQYDKPRAAGADGGTK
jgi:hypothetical protein